MHSYKATICQSVPRLVNLTDSAITVYSSEGHILKYEPKRIELPDYRMGVFYAVDRETYDNAEKHGRRTLDLVLIEGVSQGRDGADIASLRLYDDPKIKVYPVYNRYTTE